MSLEFRLSLIMLHVHISVMSVHLDCFYNLGLRLRDEVSSMFLKFAAAAPHVELSPQHRRTILATNVLPEASPDSKAKRNALTEPTKKSLKALDKNLQSHEAAVRKGLQDLDKATNDFRESKEAQIEMKKRLAEKLEAKRRKAEQATEKGRRHIGCNGHPN